MPEYRITDYIGHMIEAAKAVQVYVAAMSKQKFLRDKRTQEAVIFNIIKIGEAAPKLRQNYLDFTLQHSQIDWRAICAMRNRMTHGYFNIDEDIVWQTTQGAIPKLLRDLHAIQPADDAG